MLFLTYSGVDEFDNVFRVCMMNVTFVFSSGEMKEYGKGVKAVKPHHTIVSTLILIGFVCTWLPVFSLLEIVIYLRVSIATDFLKLFLLVY